MAFKERLERVTEERDILKKSLAYFAEDQSLILKNIAKKTNHKGKSLAKMIKRL